MPLCTSLFSQTYFDQNFEAACLSSMVEDPIVLGITSPSQATGKGLIATEFALSLRIVFVIARYIHILRGD